MWQNRKQPGFTLVELLLAIVMSSFLIAMTASVYTLFRQSTAKNQVAADLTQNARVALDKLVRELRESNEVITVLPADPTDMSVAQPGAIEFADGLANNLTYRRYYLQGSVLKMDTKEYTVSSFSSQRVPYDTLASGGAAATATVTSTVDIADRVQSIAFYGGRTIRIDIVTTDGDDQQLTYTTSVSRRN